MDSEDDPEIEAALYGPKLSRCGSPKPYQYGCDARASRAGKWGFMMRIWPNRAGWGSGKLTTFNGPYATEAAARRAAAEEIERLDADTRPSSAPTATRGRPPGKSSNSSRPTSGDAQPRMLRSRSREASRDQGACAHVTRAIRARAARAERARRRVFARVGALSFSPPHQILRR